MNIWEPDKNAHQVRRIGKTLEELGELSAVLARISIQGLNAIDPETGKFNHIRLMEETADVIAQINCNIAFFAMDFPSLVARREAKEKQMAQWEMHFKE